MRTGYRCTRGQRSVLLVLAFLAALLVVGQASAFETIRQVSWTETSKIQWAPGRSSTSLAFDAEITPLEAAYSVTSFSVAILRPVGAPEILARYSIGPLPVRVPAGTRAHIATEFSMMCDPFRGGVDLTLGNATVTVLHPVLGELTYSVAIERMRTSASSRTTFGLAIIDMNGNVHPTMLSSDTFSCITADDHGSIGVYFDREGTVCTGTIPGGTVGKVYVLAKLSGGTAGGVAGAQFRFTGAPSAWEVYAVPNPAIISNGDPFVDGVVAGFTCQQPGAAGPVLLYTVLVIAHETIDDVRFEIGERVPTLTAACPMLLACDEPVFTKFCVEGLSCYVNATRSTPCIALAVETTTWSSVKAMFR